MEPTSTTKKHRLPPLEIFDRYLRTHDWDYDFQPHQHGYMLHHETKADAMYHIAKSDPLHMQLYLVHVDHHSRNVSAEHTDIARARLLNTPLHLLKEKYSI